MPYYSAWFLSPPYSESSFVRGPRVLASLGDSCLPLSATLSSVFRGQVPSAGIVDLRSILSHCLIFGRGWSPELALCACVTYDPLVRGFLVIKRSLAWWSCPLCLLSCRALLSSPFSRPLASFLFLPQFSFSSLLCFGHSARPWVGAFSPFSGFAWLPRAPFICAPSFNSPALLSPTCFSPASFCVRLETCPCHRASSGWSRLLTVSLLSRTWLGLAQPSSLDLCFMFALRCPVSAAAYSSVLSRGFFCSTSNFPPTPSSIGFHHLVSEDNFLASPESVALERLMIGLSARARCSVVGRLVLGGYVSCFITSIFTLRIQYYSPSSVVVAFYSEFLHNAFYMLSILHIANSSACWDVWETLLRVIGYLPHTLGVTEEPPVEGLCHLGIDLLLPPVGLIFDLVGGPLCCCPCNLLADYLPGNLMYNTKNVVSLYFIVGCTVRSNDIVRCVGYVPVLGYRYTGKLANKASCTYLRSCSIPSWTVVADRIRMTEARAHWICQLHA
nr:hypothetical protein Iba_chr05cCG11280 [Ipomoea batatas]